MPETSIRTPGITCPQDRIDILKDLVEFHAGRNVRGASQILDITVERRERARGALRGHSRHG